MEEVQIIFDDETGKFVVHFDGMSHEKSHAELDKIIDNLKAQGFEIDYVRHIHGTTPKHIPIPEEEPKVPERELEGLENSG